MGVNVRAQFRQFDQTDRTDPSWASANRSIQWLIVTLLAIQGAIAVANLTPIVDTITIAEILDVNKEATAAVWLSSAMLWTIALLAAYAAVCDRATGAVRRAWVGWLVIATGFMILSIDETSQIHERIGDKVSDFVQVPFLPELYSWVLVVAPIALLGAIWMLRWISSTVGFRSLTTRLAIAAVALWVLVPGFEALDPTLGAPAWLIVLEETCETLGATLFMAGMLVYLRDRGWLRLPITTEDRD